MHNELPTDQIQTAELRPTELPSTEHQTDQIPTPELATSELPADELPTNEIPPDELPPDQLPTQQNTLHEDIPQIEAEAIVHEDEPPPYCADCGRELDEDDEYENPEGEAVCSRCAEHYAVCDHCNSVVPLDDSTWIESEARTVCDVCLDRLYFWCEECEQYYPEEMTTELTSGGWICNDCYENGDYSRCDRCGDVCSNDDLFRRGDSYYCRICAGQIKNSEITQYSYKPDWIKHSDPGEKDRFYLGIELEVENTSGCRWDNDDVARDVKSIVPAICKQDCSIGYGFEIVFHPQTYGYATGKGRKAIEECLALLRARRFSGHNYGGMHVHISLDAFSQLHLYKFHRLFKNARSLFTALSQRHRDKLDEWASFCMPNKPGANEDRYVALNYTDSTVEVRIFNSTIRTDRFYKNLETVKAAIDFSREASIQDLWGNNFMAYIMQNRGIYRNLAAFLVEKCVGRLEAAPVAARVIRQVQKRIAHSAA